MKKVLTDFAPPEAEAVMAEPIPAAPEPAPVPYVPPCKADEMPCPSKLVMVQDADGERKAMLWWADQFHPVAKDDVAWSLPVGARIQRLPETFVATQLDRPELEPMYGATARELIAKFRTYIGS